MTHSFCGTPCISLLCPPFVHSANDQMKYRGTRDDIVGFQTRDFCLRDSGAQRLSVAMVAAHGMESVRRLLIRTENIEPVP